MAGSTPKKLNVRSGTPTGPSAHRSIQRKATLRKILAAAGSEPLISKAKIRLWRGEWELRVHFTDGIVEHWGFKIDGSQDTSYKNYFPITQDNIFSDEIPIYHEFESNPLDPNFEDLQRYFLVQRKDCKKAGFIAGRLLVHKLIDQLLKEGWQELRYPQAALIREFEKLKKEPVARYYQNGMFLVHPGGPNTGSVLLRHFNMCGSLAYKNRPTLLQAWRAETLCQAINLLICNSNITRSSIVRTMNTGLPQLIGPKFASVGVWRAIFEVIRPTGIIDPYPELGEKAIAASIADLGYQALDTELTSWLKLKAAANPDLVILTGTEPVSDETLRNRLGPYRALAVVTPDQAALLKPIKSWKIKQISRYSPNILVLLPPETKLL